MPSSAIAVKNPSWSPPALGISVVGKVQDVIVEILGQPASTMARGGSFTEEQTALIVSVLESRTIPRPKVQALIDVLRTMPELKKARKLLTRWHLRKQGLMTSKVPASALLVRKREPGKRKKRLTGHFAGFAGARR